ncbi:chloride channel protein [Corynebacterium sp.]|uniref:chloride channel protein n=1 Tax=Corynebacterium sp. TaxID=1720 RepID=UPI0026DD8DB6|nr:chloride channel protein [Corynebacterium sp.]MDO4610216.1 chloride channel protein [Corynebacterium sp.]
MKGTELVRLVVLTFVVGVATGLAAAALMAALHGIETVVYGHHEGQMPLVVDGTTWQQRFIGITVAGLIAGPAWWALRRWGRPVLPVEDGMSGSRLPVVETTANVVLQMATVAAGASVGRENAPREEGAMVASQLSSRLGLDADTTRILVAAAAGAGLGAIYQIPLAGAVFSLEILLSAITVRAVMVVLACSGVATTVSGLMVGHGPLYSPMPVDGSLNTVIAGIALGVVCGALGVGFRRIIAWAEDNAPSQGVLWQLPLAFVAVGVIAIWLPWVLGNGRNAATLVLQQDPGLLLIAALAVGKFAAVVVTLRSGAVGGVLTPGFSLGALLGYLLGAALAPMLPGVTPAAFAIIGAAAFLSTTMAAPLFALVVVVEFTGQPSSAYLPLFFAAATAAATAVVMRVLLNMDWGRITGQRMLH